MDHIRNHTDVVKGLISPEIRTDDTIPYFDEVIDTPVRNELLNPKKDEPFNPRENEIKTEVPYVGEIIDIETEKVHVPVKPKRLKLNEATGEINNGEKNSLRSPGVIHASDLGEIHKSPDKDTIVVNTPEGTLYITLEPDLSKSSNPTSPSTQSTDFSSPSTSKASGALDSSDLIENERDVEARRAGLRRNSISMPTLQNLESEVLKQYINNNPQEGILLVKYNMRLRKRPDLRLDIPSYPHDYVEMPPEVRRLTLESMQTPNINDSPSIVIQSPDGNVVGSTTNQKPDINDTSGSKSNADDNNEGNTSNNFENPDSTTRLNPPRTPEVQIVGPEDVRENGDRNNYNISDLSENESRNQTVESNQKDNNNSNHIQNSNPNDVKNEEKKYTSEAETAGDESPVVYRNQLRRGSVSVPHGLRYHEADKKICINIPEHHQSSASGFSDGDDHHDHNEVLSDDSGAKAPLRSPRRKSLAPRRLRSEFSMDDDYSPSNSVTSVNSLASLLKEKLQSIPQKMRKKPSDYKLRAFVSLMFLSVVFFVGFAYVLYHRQALTKAYFDSVQFNEPQRLVRIYNTDDVEILKASLAANLEGKVKAFPCLPEHRRTDGSECLEWLHTFRFYLKSIPHDPGLDNTTCFSIHWQALRSDVLPNDCFDWGDTKVHWYGGGQSSNISWPLDTGYIDYTSFITGDMQKSQWGNVLTRYFINSKGAAIIIDEETPLQVAVNQGGKQLCLRAKHDEFAYANKLTEFPEMKYNICTSGDMRSLHSSIHSHRRAPLWDGLKPADMQTLDSLISEPVWQIAPRFKHELQTETISKYTEDVINLGFLKQGHVLINEHWQNEIGDLSVDKSRFDTLNITVDKLHRRGFKVAFTVQPFISTESKNFGECVQKRLLISERNSDRRIPALTRFKSLASAGVLDITNNRSVPWILSKLQAVIDEYHIDSFYFDLGTAYDMPHYYRCEKYLTNPDQYKTIFTKTFEKTLNIIGVSSAISLPPPPIFVSLPPFESSWEALGTVIPTMLTYGVNGFPFIMPGAVGGDIYWPGSEQFLPTSKGSLEPMNTTQENGIELPEKELYIRWLQMATFLPVMKFTHLPSKYNDEKVLEIAKNLTLLRQKLVTPLLLKFKREALEEGLPLIRPLWLLGGEGGGEAALLVRDEFVIGDELLVAPVLRAGQTTREVYLPAGLWQDGVDGSLRKGNRWMHDYRVPLARVAYFLRRPDDMRFR